MPVCLLGLSNRFQVEPVCCVHFLALLVWVRLSDVDGVLGTFLVFPVALSVIRTGSGPGWGCFPCFYLNAPPVLPVSGWGRCASMHSCTLLVLLPQGSAAPLCSAAPAALCACPVALIVHP